MWAGTDDTLKATERCHAIIVSGRRLAPLVWIGRRECKKRARLRPDDRADLMGQVLLVNTRPTRGLESGSLLRLKAQSLKSKP